MQCIYIYMILYRYMQGPNVQGPYIYIYIGTLLYKDTYVYICICISHHTYIYIHENIISAIYGTFGYIRALLYMQGPIQNARAVRLVWPVRLLDPCDPYTRRARPRRSSEASLTNCIYCPYIWGPIYRALQMGPYTQSPCVQGPYTSGPYIWRPYIQKHYIQGPKYEGPYIRLQGETNPFLH